MKMIERTITTVDGKKVKIRPGEHYCVVYKMRGLDGEWIEQVDFGASLNYPQDQYIGHDDCEGRACGPRFYFDDTASRTRQVINVMTVAEALARLSQVGNTSLKD